jgi:hypothetical protein
VSLIERCPPGRGVRKGRFQCSSIHFHKMVRRSHWRFMHHLVVVPIGIFEVCHPNVVGRPFNYMSLTAYNAGTQIQDAQIKPKHVPKIRFKI